MCSFSLQVKHKHFKHGDLKLKCTATISTVYWKSNEESVQGSGFNAHSAPVSESRGRTSGWGRFMYSRSSEQCGVYTNVLLYSTVLTKVRRIPSP